MSAPSAPKSTIVLDVVGLTPGQIGPDTPHLAKLAGRGSLGALECPFPALTLSSQASILTGRTPSAHGIVGNGWYWPELGEVLLWRQPHEQLEVEDLPTRLRRERPGFTVAKLFWWFNMGAPVDHALTPRPMYPADGRKIPDIHTHPQRWRGELQARFGTFPLFKFWGPLADLSCSEWITKASLDLIERERPSLSLVYLPHLDYDHQRYGPEHAKAKQALREVDALCGRFIAYAQEHGARLVILSEYGIAPVSRPVHPNRALREAGLLGVRLEEGRERFDPMASQAFAVSDHQVAHIVIRDPQVRSRARDVLAQLPGVRQVLEGESRAAAGLDHPRAGELVLVSEPDAWFTYYYWLDEALRPDYANTVDIHRKPGYDPAELFLDPALAAPKLRVARRLLGKKLGFRNLLDVVGTDASLVKGSHGLKTEDPAHGPILMVSEPDTRLDPGRPLPLADMPDWLAGHCPR